VKYLLFRKKFRDSVLNHLCIWGDLATSEEGQGIPLEEWKLSSSSVSKVADSRRSHNLLRHITDTFQRDQRMKGK